MDAGANRCRGSSAWAAMMAAAWTLVSSQLAPVGAALAAVTDLSCAPQDARAQLRAADATHANTRELITSFFRGDAGSIDALAGLIGASESHVREAIHDVAPGEVWVSYRDDASGASGYLGAGRQSSRVLDRVLKLNTALSDATCCVTSVEAYDACMFVYSPSTEEWDSNCWYIVRVPAQEAPADVQVVRDLSVGAKSRPWSILSIPQDVNQRAERIAGKVVDMQVIDVRELRKEFPIAWGRLPATCAFAIAVSMLSRCDELVSKETNARERLAVYCDEQLPDIDPSVARAIGQLVIECLGGRLAVEAGKRGIDPNRLARLVASLLQSKPRVSLDGVAVMQRPSEDNVVARVALRGHSPVAEVHLLLRLTRSAESGEWAIVRLDEEGVPLLKEDDRRDFPR